MSIQKEIEKRVMAEMAAQAVPMSRNDQVIIRKSEPDAPGVYVASEQQRVDEFGRRIAAMNGKFYGHGRELFMY